MSSTTNTTSFHCDLTGGMVWKFPVMNVDKSTDDTENNQSAVKDSKPSFNSYKEFNKQLLQALRANPKILGN